MREKLLKLPRLGLYNLKLMSSRSTFYVMDAKRAGENLIIAGICVK
jgi:hypothetical protein